MASALDSTWIAAGAKGLAARAERDLEDLVAISSPNGDVGGAEAAIAVVERLLPATTRVERIESSSAGYAPDLLATIEGSGTGRLLLLGHLDTVVAHDQHRAVTIESDRLVGSGTIDMKGGNVIAAGVMRALAAVPASFAEVSLLLVTDEEWRQQPFTHGQRFSGWDACLCFEAGDSGPDGGDAVVARRKGACTLGVDAFGVAAHSGAAPEAGVNALLALAELAPFISRLGDPRGRDRLTVVPTVIESGEVFNVVPATGRLVFDLRADDERAFEAVLDAVPAELGGARLEAGVLRLWPGMDTGTASATLLDRASALLGRPIHAGARGGASDASHIAKHVPVTLDGLGPLGGAAHNPDEYVLSASFGPRAEVALACAAAALE